MLFLNEQHLRACLDYTSLQNEMAQALIHVSNEKATNFPRVALPVKQDGSPLGLMAAVDHTQSLLGYKVITVFHDNRAKQLNPHQGLVVYLNSETGRVQSVLDASYVTAVRTAAVSAVATHHLSRHDASNLALVGSGVQALEHIKAISSIRSIRRLFIYSRTRASYEALCNQLVDHSFLEMTFCESPQAAVSEADIVVTCTSSKKALLSLDELPPGCHINAIGACRPNEIEVKFSGGKHIKIYMDSQNACFAESEEIKQLAQNPILAKQMIVGEIGSLLANTLPGRCSVNEITCFKSVGLAIEDLFAAHYFYKQAVKRHIGQLVEW